MLDKQPSMLPRYSESHSAFLGKALLAGVLLLALILRLSGMVRPVWIDEVLTLEWAAKPYWDILSGNISPFLTVTAKTMLAIFRSEAVVDEVVIRMPHLLFGLAGIAAVFLFLRRTSGLVAATVGGLYLATLPKHIAYSQDARYYAFALLATLLFLFCSRAYAKEPCGRVLLGVGITAFAACFNHLSAYLALPAITGATALIIVFVRGGGLRARLGAVVPYALVIAVAAASPFALNLAMNRAQTVEKFLSVLSPADDVAPEEGSAASPQKLERYRLSPVQYFKDFVWLGFVQTDGVVPGVFCGLLLLAGCVYLVLSDRALIFLLACAFFLPPLPGFLFSTGHNWVERYFVVEMGVLAILAGYGARAVADAGGRAFGKLPGRGAFFAAALVALCLFVMVWGRSPLYANPHGALTDVGQQRIARHVAENAAQNDTVAFFMSRHGWRPTKIFQYYMDRHTGTRPSLGSSLRYEHVGNYDELKSLLLSKGLKNLWVVTEPDLALPGVSAKFAGEGFVPVCRTPESLLWVMGVPTTNMISGGDFESDSPVLTLPPEAQVVDGTEGYMESRSVRVSVSPDVPEDKRPMPTVWFSLSPAKQVGEKAAPAMFEAGEFYTLSFCLKCADVQPGEFPKRAIRAIVAGKGFFVDYLVINGTHDWRRYEATLRAGTDFPTDLRSPRIGIGNRGGSGTFWLDEVQFEKQPKATPFTRDTRAASTPAGQN